jgi:hypothetical protein
MTGSLIAFYDHTGRISTMCKTEENGQSGVLTFARND